MRSTGLAALCAVLVGCGTSSSGGLARDAGSCLPIAAETYCSASSPCCGAGYCDPATTRCRDGSRCGQTAEGCDETHPCCSGLTCLGHACSGQAGPSTTGGGSSGSATSTSGGSTGSCHGVAQACITDADCCSFHCATGNHLCAASTTASSSTSSTGGGSTTGGTCSSAGTACGSSTECCSRVCNSGLCG